jgi:hypothetical protein
VTIKSPGVNKLAEAWLAAKATAAIDSAARAPLNFRFKITNPPKALPSRNHLVLQSAKHFLVRNERPPPMDA